MSFYHFAASNHASILTRGVARVRSAPSASTSTRTRMAPRRTAPRSASTTTPTASCARSAHCSSGTSLKSATTVSSTGAVTTKMIGSSTMTGPTNLTITAILRMSCGAITLTSTVRGRTRATALRLHRRTTPHQTGCP